MGKYALCFLIIGLLLGADAPRHRATDNGGTVEDKVREAFPDGKGSKAAIRCYLRSKGLLLTADACVLEPDGRLKLTACAIARFQEAQGPDKASRPTTIRSPWACLTLDRPIRTINELGDRKIVSVELAGGVRLLLEE